MSARYVTECPDNDLLPAQVVWRTNDTLPVYTRLDDPANWRWIESAVPVDITGDQDVTTGYLGWWVILRYTSRETVTAGGAPHEWYCDTTHYDLAPFAPANGGAEFFSMPANTTASGVSGLSGPDYAIRSVGIGNPDDLEQPDYPTDDPAWSDNRVLMALDGWDWPALQVYHNDNVTLWQFDSDDPFLDGLSNCAADLSGGFLRLTVTGAAAYATGNYLRRTTLTADAATDDTSLPVVSTANFPDAGELRLMRLSGGVWEWNDVRYTSKTGTTFDGCSGVKSNLSGERVELIGPWVCDYRYIDLDWEARDGGGNIDESATLRVWLGAKWWDLTWDADAAAFEKRIDLCRPHSDLAQVASAAQQSMMDFYFPRSIGKYGGGTYIPEAETSVAPGFCDVTVPVRNRFAEEYKWYWGVDRVNTVKFSSLVNGDTYKVRTIKGIILNRITERLVSAEQWGFRRQRSTDDVAKVRSGVEPGPSSTYSIISDEVLAVVLCDGRPVAEITGQVWKDRSGVSCCEYWHIDPAIEDINYWPRRPGYSLISTLRIVPAAGTGYLSNDRDMRHLRIEDSASVTEFPGTTINARIRTDRVMQVIGSGRLPWALRCRKRFGHEVHGLVFEGADPAINRAVTLRYGTGGALSKQIVTDSQGAFTARLPRQEDTITVEASTTGGATGNSVDLPVRQRKMTFCGLADSWTTGGCDIAIDQLTGIGIMAYLDAGALKVKRTQDYGKTWEAAIAITEASGPSSPCVWHCPDAHRLFGVAWTEASAVKLVRSANFFKNYSVVKTLLSNATHGRCAVNQLTGIMLAAGFRSGDIVIARSDNYGFVSTEIGSAVTGVPEADFGLYYCPDAHGRWVLVYQDSAGDYQTLWSMNNGKTWEVAS